MKFHLHWQVVSKCQAAAAVVSMGSVLGPCWIMLPCCCLIHYVTERATMSDQVVLALFMVPNWMTLQGPSHSLFVSIVHFQNAGRFCCETWQPKIVKPMSPCERRPKFSTIVLLLWPVLWSAQEICTRHVYLMQSHKAT